MDYKYYDVLCNNCRKLKGIKVAIYALQTEIAQNNISHDLDLALELLGDQISEVAKSIDQLLESENTQ